MSASDQDLELLENLLDGELSIEQSDAVRARVSSEPALAEALDRIRSQRDLRQQIWRTMEPAESQVAGLVSSVRSAIARDEVWARRARALRYVSGLAACILVGFMGGRFFSARDTGIFVEPAVGPMQQVVDQPAPVAPRGGGYKVLLTDAYGRVIAEQPFASFDEAREFTEDLNRLRSPRKSRPVRVSDTIFTKDQF
jgi:anti-sigma factor RsiW